MDEDFHDHYPGKEYPGRPSYAERHSRPRSAIWAEVERLLDHLVSVHGLSVAHLGEMVYAASPTKFDAEKTRTVLEDVHDEEGRKHGSTH